jgi:hypothetical protein
MRIEKMIIQVVERGPEKYEAFPINNKSAVFVSTTQENAIAACVAGHSIMFEEFIVTAHNTSTGLWSARLATDDDSRDIYAFGVTQKRAIEALCASRWKEFATPLFPSAIYG